MFQPLCHVLLKSSEMTRRVHREGGAGCPPGGAARGPACPYRGGAQLRRLRPAPRTSCRPGRALRALLWRRSAAGCAVVLAVCLSLEALPVPSSVQLPGAGVRL